MKLNHLLFKKLTVSFLALLSVLLLALFITRPDVYNVFFLKKTNSLDDQYLNGDTSNLLKLGEEADWNGEGSLSLLLPYANAVYESKIEVPSTIVEHFPSVSDFVAAYSSTRLGQLSVARSYLKKLALTKVAVYSGIGLLDLYSYSNNTVALCDSVNEYKQSKLFVSRNAKGMLTDYELDCLVKSGKYGDAKEILNHYEANDINDKFKKNLILINILNLTGKYQESKDLIKAVKSSYGSNENLILNEAVLYRLSDGYEKALMFLKNNMSGSTPLLNQTYAIYLANSDVKKTVEALEVLNSNMADHPNDIEAQLVLAHFCFDSGYRVPLERTFTSLASIKDIGEFSDFNLLEAKVALLNKNLTAVDTKLRQTGDKNPFGKLFLWFSYQYNDLIKRQNIAKQYLERYLIIEPNNQIVKKLLEGKTTRSETVSGGD